MGKPVRISAPATTLAAVMAFWKKTRRVIPGWFHADVLSAMGISFYYT
jgi:hypothetical protein